MNNDWATQQLQTIRTLMERSALYRRALAPVTTLAGCIGLAAGSAGYFLQLSGPKWFVGYWIGVALVIVITAVLLMRRQAFKDAETFWSPPTRRVAQAMALPFFAALVFSGLAFLAPEDSDLNMSMVMLWLMLYGLALNAAGFFMRRGIRLFGWLMALAGLGLAVFQMLADLPALDYHAHIVMGALFGGSHLIYGIYLYFSERKTAGL